MKTSSVPKIGVALSGGGVRGFAHLGVLQVLEEAYPGLTPYLRAADGTLLPKVNLYVNDEHVRYLEGVQTPLRDGDHVYIVPLVMGG